MERVGGFYLIIFISPKKLLMPTLFLSMLEVGKYAAYVWNELQHKQILVQIMIYI
jgi:hypothetical protein